MSTGRPHTLGLLGSVLRPFGLLVLGLVCFCGGGLVVVYGLVLFAVAPPGGKRVGPTLAPVNEAVVSVVTEPLFHAVVLVGVVGFAWEVKRNGLWPTDDRLLAEIIDERRRQLAEEREEWSHPDVEEDTDVYEDLRAEQDADRTPALPSGEDGDLVVLGDRYTTRPRGVQGVIENQGEQAYSHVSVEVAWIVDGEVVDTGAALKSSLGEGDRWRFEVFWHGSADPDDYRIRTVSAS